MTFQILQLFTFFLVIRYLVVKSGANTIGLSEDQVHNCENLRLQEIQINRASHDTHTMNVANWIKKTQCTLSVVSSQVRTKT